MDPFASPPLPGSGHEVSNEVMMDQVKQQLAQAYAEEFYGVCTSHLASNLFSAPLLVVLEALIQSRG